MKSISINKFFYFLLILFTAFSMGCQKESPVNKEGWELTFSEEFNDTILNRNVWKTEFPWGQNSKDDTKVYYIDTAFNIKNGVLQIVVKQDSVLGLVHDDNYNYFLKPFAYTAGLLHSDEGFLQKFGYFECRARIPSGNGFWPAFWMMSHNKWPPEIDVFEIIGKEPNRLHMTNHFTDKNLVHQKYSKTLIGPDFSKDFHVFALEWNSYELVWYLDNEEVFRSRVGIPEDRMYLILSIGLGGGFSGEPDNSTPLPNFLEVDYVRVYSKK